MKKLYKKYKEIANYLIVGALTTVVSLGIYYVLVLSILNPRQPVQLQIANVISWIGSVTFAYFTNRRFVFESKNPKILREAGAFFAARLGTLIMDMLIMFLLVTVFIMNDKIAKILVQVVIVIANYLFSKFWVFRKRYK